MKKIDVEKSTIFTSDYDSASSCMRKGYMGKEGYFTNDADCAFLYTGKLNQVIYEEHTIYYCFDDVRFKFFIPRDKAVFVKEPATKKYRPYMGLAELPFVIGDIIRYRCKQCCSEYKGIAIEVEYQKNYPYEIDSIIIGGIKATPQELFDHYELLDKDCKYVPFGFEE